MLNDNKAFYSLTEIADHFSVTYACVWTWIKAGKLRGTRIGSTHRVAAADLRDFLQDNLK